MSAFFFREIFFRFLRIFWNVCRSEFERNRSKTKIFDERLKKTSVNGYICIRFRTLCIFWDQKQNLVTYAGRGRLCVSLSRKFPRFPGNVVLLEPFDLFSGKMLESSYSQDICMHIILFFWIEFWCTYCIYKIIADTKNSL